jgi:hypothetical protein
MYKGFLSRFHRHLYRAASPIPRKPAEERHEVHVYASRRVFGGRYARSTALPYNAEKKPMIMANAGDSVHGGHSPEEALAVVRV